MSVILKQNTDAYSVMRMVSMTTAVLKLAQVPAVSNPAKQRLEIMRSGVW